MAICLFFIKTNAVVACAKEPAVVMMGKATKGEKPSRNIKTWMGTYMPIPMAGTIHNVLAVKEGNEWKFVLLSVEEALFFQQELAKERGKPNTSPRKIWLLSPNGNLLQQGRDALTPHQNEAAFTRGIVQTLAFSGDLLALMKRRLSVQEWAKSQENAKFSLVMDRLDRAKQKRFQKSKLYTCFPERVRASAAA